MNERDYDGLTMDYFQNQLLAKGITKEMFNMDQFAGLTTRELQNIVNNVSLKIENLGCWYKNLLADAEALKAQKNAFAEREKAAKAKAESLKGFLSRYLNGKKFETAKVAMSFRKSEAVEFDAKCIGDVPEEFLKFKDPELDKVAVKKAIKAGETVPGCELVARQNLQIK